MIGLRLTQRLAAGTVAGVDTCLRRVRSEHGQATVEYVGLVIVLGTGIGMIVAGLDTLGFVVKVGGKLVKGVTTALDKLMPG